MKSYWEEQQKVFDETGNVKYIANSSPQKIWRFLQVEKKLKKGIKVLNIGVGTGKDTRALNDLGVEVSVLDISTIALERVQDFAKGYLASDLKKLPSNYFDVAISHLVSQHMGDKQLLEQFEHVIRSLTDKGVFALQFAWAEGEVVGDESVQKVGECSRYISRMDYLVDKAGGKIVKEVTPIIYKNILWSGKNRDVVWFGVHISRK